MNGGIGLHGARKKIDLIDVSGVESEALNGDAAARHVETLNAAIRVEDGSSGRENAARGVDEPPAVDHDARTVRHDDFSPAPRDFEVASQLARRIAIHLIQDDASRLVWRKMRVPVDHARLLRLRHRRCIVQNHAGVRDVELGIRVLRNTGGAWRIDIDLLKAIGCLHHGRWQIARGGDLRMG
nr:hypothetical protein [Pandoraea capi]